MSIVGDVLRTMNLQLGTRFSELERKAGHGMRYQGIHEGGRAYKEGDTCTRSGSLWIAMRRRVRAAPFGHFAQKPVAMEAI